MASSLALKGIADPESGQDRQVAGSETENKQNWCELAQKDQQRISGNELYNLR